MIRLRVLGLVLLVLQAARPWSASGQGHAPEDAPGRMTPADGLEVRLFASEPLIRQPVAIEFDDRGRLWVIQYLQYPNPAGLKRVKVDRYSRTAYDRVPDPPPRGPRGEDRITILEDVDGDGRADHGRDFVNGLNLTSGLAFGHGGVFVLQVPYLLFYPDRDRDDRPDGDPVVLLTGFGMEDAHSVANSLTWGPDGWLYGLQGSTVTARVRGIEFQQGVWRYHPVSRRFELFCEGGGNMWGLDFDRTGQLFASTNVGGFVMLHAVQGGYYWKSFGKHGPLHNPYTFGYFDHVPHAGLSGGHVSVGGLFYEADAFPAGWRGRYIAGDLLGHAVHFHEVLPRGSSYGARQLGDVLRGNDTWFATSDQTLGPDGALYITDWHDRRTAHPDPDADWDRTNGRIYRVAARGNRTTKVATRDLARAPVPELLGLLEDPNVWYRRRARRVLAERGAKEAAGPLRMVVDREGGPKGLEALWTLHGIGALDPDLVVTSLGHADPDVRGWVIRLAGDEPGLPTDLASRIVDLASHEPAPRVRSQLAATARRLGVAEGLNIASALLARDLDGDDPHIPLLIWWAIERHALADLEGTLGRFAVARAWRSNLFRTTIAGRLIRRLSVEGRGRTDLACVRLLESAPSSEDRRTLLQGLEEGLRSRDVAGVDPGLAKAIVVLASANPSESGSTRLAARLGDPPSLRRMRQMIADRHASAPERLAMIRLAGELKDREALDLLLPLATDPTNDPLGLEALAALGRFDDGRIGRALVSIYGRQGTAWRGRARELLLGRVAWARSLLEAVDRGEIPAGDIALDQLARFPTLRDPGLAGLVRKHYGTTRGATPEERLAEVRRLNNDLRAAPGDPARGRLLFREKCATCHRLGGEGETIAPDLTFANRQDRDFLLTSLVDPGGVVRKEYQLFTLATADGRVLSGLIVEQTPDSITLADAKGQRTRIPRADVAEFKEADSSLMPESLYREFRPEQLRDLFSYLQDPTITPPKGRP